MSIDEAATWEHGSEDDTGIEDFGSRFFAPQAPPVRVTFGAATHQGKVRPNNEDHYAIIQRTRSRKVLRTNLPLSDLAFEDDVAYTLVVADGVGGASFGELASRLAIRTFGDLAGQASSWLMRLRDVEAQQVRQRVDAYSRAMQRAFVDLGRIDPRMSHMGTTWTSACVLGADAIIAHAGDSRAYRFRAGEVAQITRDHTLGQLMFEGGSPEDEVAAYRHVLLNCFGGGGQSEVKVEIHNLTLRDGDRLLLCTDGLTDHAQDADLARVLTQEPEPQAACDELLSLALARGGRDNITVVIARLELAGNGGGRAA